MHRRSHRSWIALAPMFAATILASCAEETTTGPRIATLVQVSGGGQQGAIGATLAQPMIVRVEDQSGNPVPGSTIFWEIVSGGGSISPSQSTTDAQGYAQASLRLGTSLGLNSVRATLGLLNPVLFSATATAAPPSKLLAQSGDGQNAVVATLLGSDLVVKVTDAVDNPKSGVVVTFAVTSGGGSLNIGSVSTDANGLGSARWTLGNSTGIQTALASVSGLTPLTFTATGRPAAADALAILTGNNQTGTPGAALTDSLRVKLTDRFGNPISGATVTWVPNANSGAVSPVTSTTDALGRAATKWTLGNTGGPKVVVASAAGFAQTFNGGGNVTYLTMNAGSRHSCGVAQGGVAYCWGYNGDGQLGIGAVAGGSGPVFALPQPTGTIGNLTFAQVSAGRYHNCSLTLAGVGYCWGINVDGRLGTGGNAAASSPTTIVGTRAYTTISAGQVHSCGLDLAGRGFCWGSNTDGQLGVVGGAFITPDSLSISSPTAVVGGMLFQSISAGGLHACAVTTGGAGFCWGNNALGQLGDGTPAPAIAPRAIGAPLILTAVSAGNSHSCAITVAGAAWCWGSNASGQLGTGLFVGSSLPVGVTGAIAFTSITAGNAHSCGLTAAGALFCWGSNAKGQIGDGSLTTRPAPTVVGAGLVWQAVSAGDTHTCAVTTGNVAYCWGDNEYGQLGDGTVVNRLTPMKVAFQP